MLWNVDRLQRNALGISLVSWWNWLQINDCLLQELQAHKDVDEYGVQHQVMQEQVHLLQVRSRDVISGRQCKPRRNHIDSVVPNSQQKQAVILQRATRRRTSSQWSGSGRVDPCVSVCLFFLWSAAGV